MVKRIRTTAAALIVAFCAGCGGLEREPVRPLQPLRFGVTRVALSAPVYVAADKGMFRDEGLAVSLDPYVTGTEAIAALGRHADMITAADVPLALAAFHRSTYRIVATLGSTRQEPAIVARAGAVSSPAALAGKTLGTTHGTSSDFFLDSYLIVEGVAPAAVNVVHMKPDEMAAALRQGRVDAAVAWNPPLADLEKVPGMISFSSDSFPMSVNVAADETFLNRHPEEVRRLLRALIRAEKYMRKHPAESREIVRKRLGISEEAIGRRWGGYNFNVRLREPLLISLENSADWAIRRGRETGEPPDFRRFIAPGPLQSVAPEAVRLIR
jgi:ABC-type nitrate/sulfonate/bicarbonate transport system substrate-binding protein